MEEGRAGDMREGKKTGGEGKGKEGRGIKGRGERGREGIIPVLLFLYFEPCVSLKF